ncbi:hypothetical protein D9M68_913400 [compost metagenome]
MHAVLLVEQPDRRLAVQAGQRRSWQHHVQAAGASVAGSDHRSQLHCRRRINQCHLDLHRAAAFGHRGGHFADAPAAAYPGVVKQHHLNAFGELDSLVQHALIDMEHRIPAALAGQTKHRGGSLHHLAYFGLA